MSTVTLPSTTARNAVAGGVLSAAVLSSATVFVAGWEGLRQDPYWDIARVRTVCYGETLNVQERHHSRAECDALLARSLEKHAARAMACLAPTRLLSVGVQVAFISLAYNIGTTAFCKSSIVRQANAGNLVASCKAILLYDKIKSPKTGTYVVSRGLQNRRIAESELCMKGVQ